MTDWATLIPEAPFDWALIPLDGRKRPIDLTPASLKTTGKPKTVTTLRKSQR